MHRRPSAPLVISLIALFVALGGPAQAAKLITAQNVKRNSLTGEQIRNGSLELADLSTAAQRNLRLTPNGSINSFKLVDGAVRTPQLAGGAVTTDRIAGNAVNGTKVADNTLTTNDIATNAIGRDELETGSVASDEIVDDSVYGVDIHDGSLDGADMLDGGMGTNDIGRFTGTVTMNYGALGKGTCASRTSTSLTALTPNQDIRDDVIVITPLESFPSTGVTYDAKPASANTIEVTLCNVGPYVNLGDRPFRFVSIDAE